MVQFFQIYLIQPYLITSNTSCSTCIHKNNSLYFHHIGTSFKSCKSVVKIAEGTLTFIRALNHVDGERVIEVKVKKEGNTARISVFNTGAQIPEDDIDQIWVKFYKVDKARTREYGGSGVGLSIVKATMERHGQSYGVENRENGVEFWFTLDASNEVPELPENAETNE